MAVCCWCDLEIRAHEYPRQIGEAHFWNDFHLYASQSKEIDRNGVRKANKRFRKSHTVCPKCHFKVSITNMAPTHAIAIKIREMHSNNDSLFVDSYAC